MRSPASAPGSAAARREPPAPLDGAGHHPARRDRRVYRRRLAGYAEQVIDRVVQRLEQAQRFPESGRAVPEYMQPDIRELLEFPYRLIYRVQPDAIEVLAILHGRQDVR